MATAKKVVPSKEPKAKVVKAEVAKPAKKAESQYDISVYDLTGKAVKHVTFPAEAFSEGDRKVVAQYVRVYLANQRQGNASTKTRSEVAGTTKKVYRQKGTGRARHGAKKAPIFVGGGVTFGPQTRDFSLKINKKQRRKALLYTLADKMRNQAMMGLVASTLTIDPKTKTVAGALKTMGVDNKKVLLALSSVRSNLQKAARNISNITIANVTQINPFLVASHDVVMIDEDGITKMKDHFMKKDEK
jgi:large subunit ribosomal protein L4